MITPKTRIFLFFIIFCFSFLLPAYSLSGQEALDCIKAAGLNTLTWYRAEGLYVYEQAQKYGQKCYAAFPYKREDGEWQRDLSGCWNEIATWPGQTKQWVQDYYQQLIAAGITSAVTYFLAGGLVATVIKTDEKEGDEKKKEKEKALMACIVLSALYGTNMATRFASLSNAVRTVILWGIVTGLSSFLYNSAKCWPRVGFLRPEYKRLAKKGTRVGLLSATATLLGYLFSKSMMEYYSLG